MHRHLHYIASEAVTSKIIDIRLEKPKENISLIVQLQQEIANLKFPLVSESIVWTTGLPSSGC